MSLLETMSLVNIDGTEIAFNAVGSLQGIEYPEVSNVTTSTPGRSGQYFILSDYEKRALSWECLISSLSERRSILGIQIGSLKTLKFTTCDSLSLQAEVEITKIIIPTKHGRQKCMIQAIAPDYRLVSQSLNTSSTQVTVISGGTTLPTALPLSFSSVSGSPTLTVNNAGNAYAQTTFTITGPGTGFTVQNQTTGQSFFIDLTLLSGETVVVDTNDRTIIKGSTNQYGSFSGDFWELAPGDNVVYFNANSGSNANTLLSIDYRDSYIGV